MKNSMRRIRFILVIGVVMAAGITAACAADPTAWTGKKSQWNDYDRYDFTIDSKPCHVVVPCPAPITVPENSNPGVIGQPTYSLADL